MSSIASENTIISRFIQLLDVPVSWLLLDDVLDMFFSLWSLEQLDLMVCFW